MASSLFRAASFLQSSKLLLPKTLNGSSSFLRRISTYLPPTEEEIVSASLDIIQAAGRNSKPYDTISELAHNHPKLKLRDCTYFDIYSVISRALDGVCSSPQLDSIETFIARCTVRSALYLPENVKDLTRDQVTSRVLEVIKIFPNVDPSKVNEDTHFEQDLGLNFREHYYVVGGLRWLFRIHDIPRRLLVSDFKTVKYAVDYLYSHLDESWVPDQDSRTGSIHRDFIENFDVKEHILIAGFSPEGSPFHAYIPK